MAGPIERSLGAIATSEPAENTVKFWDFVKIDFPSPTNTLRYTNRTGGFVGDIEGSSQTWTEYDVKVGDLAQTQQKVLDVSWIDLANLNNVWSDLILNTGIEGRPVTIYQAWFDTDTDAKLGQFSPYYGRLDRAAYRDGRVRVAVTPDRSGFSQMLPARIIGPICGYIFKDTLTCQYVGAETTCDHTRAACANRSNLSHFGGFDQLPDPTKPITWRTFNFAA